MSTFRIIYKSLFFLLIVIGYFVTTLPFILVSKIWRYQARKVLAMQLSAYSKLALLLFGIKTTVGSTSTHKEFDDRTLIVSNHLSYLDVLVMAANFSSSFVTSIEMKKTPFLGQLTEAGGCLYVERRNAFKLNNEIKDLSNALKSGLRVTIFPEATSTNGDCVRPFKRPLFQSAVDSGASITPITLNYRTINGTEVGPHNRDNLFWYGDMGFLSHFISVFKIKSTEVEIFFSEKIPTDGQSNSKELALICHQRISSHFRPMCS